MKKIYKYLLFGALIMACTSLRGEETILVKDFAPDANGIVYSRNGITLTVVKDAAASHTANTAVALGCLSVNGTVPALFLRKDLTVKSYLEIGNDGSSLSIVSLKFIGSSYAGSNPSQFLLGYSVDGTTFPVAPENLYSDENSSNTALSKVVSFPADAADACTSGVEYTIPETIYQGAPSGPRTTLYPRAAIKKIRLTGDSPMQNKSLSGSQLTGENAYLYGLILKVEGISTGIEKDVAGTPMESSYYDLTGKPATADTKGFIIKRTLYDDGSITSEKLYNQ